MAHLETEDSVAALFYRDEREAENAQHCHDVRRDERPAVSRRTRIVEIQQGLQNIDRWLMEEQITIADHASLYFEMQEELHKLTEQDAA